MRALVGRRSLLLGALLVAGVAAAQAQEAGEGHDAPRKPARLFRDDTPLTITLSADFRAVFSNRDSTNPRRDPAILSFPSDSGVVTLPVELGTRGHFRLRPEVCGFPPLRVYFKGELTKETAFGGRGARKLVTHCNKAPKFEQNLLVEYGAYRAYNQLTDLSFRARLAKITYVDTKDPSRNITRYGFFLEDDDELARRNGGKIMAQTGVSYSEMDPATMDLVAIFEYLVGNTDWSAVMIHNIRLVQVEGKNEIYPVAYDFDFSGLVGAPYAMPDGRLPIKNVRQRLYRGMCRSIEQLKPTLERVAAKKDAILAQFRGLPDLDPKRLKEATDYSLDGFKPIERPKDFMTELDYSCALHR